MGGCGIANSLAEAYLYLMVTPCGGCGRGPLQGSDARRIGSAESGPLRLEIDATCGTCNRSARFEFELPHGPGVEAGTGLPTVNPTAEASRLIDVAQYLTLFRVITERAAHTKDRPDARRLGLEAAQCLEEALKFFEEGNDLPPASAFFNESSRRQLAEHPQRFSRQRLIEFRAKLPAMSRLRAPPDAPRRRKPWWKVW